MRDLPRAVDLDHWGGGLSLSGALGLNGEGTAHTPAGCKGDAEKGSETSDYEPLLSVAGAEADDSSNTFTASFFTSGDKWA